MSVSLPTNLVLVNTTNNPGTITLPPASQIRGRVITFKDTNGTFASRSLTLQTSGSDTFEDGTTTKILNETYGSIQVTASGNKWYILSATQVNTFRASTIQTLAINISTINGQTFGAPITSTMIGLGTSGYVSTLTLGVTASTIAAFTSNTSNFYTPLLLNNYSTNLASTVIGLANVGYISSTQLTSTTTGIQVLISSFIDPTELTSTVIGLGTGGYMSSIGVYSTVDGLSRFIQNNINSTIMGLGTAGFASTLGLNSTTSGLLSSINRTSNFYAPLLSNNLSSGLSTVALFTSNTSNFAAGAVQNFSTPLSTVALFTSNTSNFAQNLLQNWSTPLSTTALFTSNTSNFFRNTLTYDPSTPISSISSFLGNMLLYSPSSGISSLSLQSTVAGLGNSRYISSSQLTSTTAGVQTYVSTFLGTNQANTTGTILYLNYSTVTNSYRTLANVPSSNGLTRLVQTLTKNTTANPVSQFQTNFSLPNFIPEGIWDLNIFAYSEFTNTSLYAELYTKNAVETLIASTSNAQDLITGTNSNIPEQYTLSLPVPYTNLSTGGALVLKLLANLGNGQNDTLITYYEDGIYSHVHTSFGTLLPADVITSTVTGLGTVGYISTAQFLALSNFYRPVLSNDLSTGLSTNALFTSNTSNFSRNILQNWSTAVSTNALFTSNTSNWASNILQNWSVAVSTTAQFTSNTSNWAANFGQNFSTPLSTVAQFTSNTSNFASNLLQNFSTPLSTVAQFTSNTSNFASNILQNFSTPLSTVALFTSNTSNFAAGAIQNFSTPLSTVALFTSNTSNWTNNILITHNISAAASSVALFTSNTSNFAANLLQNFSTPLSTVALFTSNTSNFASNILQNYSSMITSTMIGLGTVGYISTPQLTSTVTGFSFIVLTSSLVASTATILSLSTQQIFNSSITGNVATYQTLSSLAIFVSSFYTATRQATPMFITF